MYFLKPIKNKLFKNIVKKKEKSYLYLNLYIKGF